MSRCTSPPIESGVPICFQRAGDLTAAVCQLLRAPEMISFGKLLLQLFVGTSSLVGILTSGYGSFVYFRHM